MVLANGTEYRARVVLFDPETDVAILAVPGLRMSSLPLSGAGPGTQGAAHVIVKGRGANLALPTLPLTPPVLVQLQASNGSCWEASYSTSVANDAHKFIAGAD